MICADRSDSKLIRFDRELGVLAVMVAVPFGLCIPMMMSDICRALIVRIGFRIFGDDCAPVTPDVVVHDNWVPAA